MTEQKIAVIGCGVWGRNIVRNFYNLGVLDTVCDIDEENRKKVEEQYPCVKTTVDYNDIINMLNKIYKEKFADNKLFYHVSYNAKDTLEYINNYYIK